ALQTRLREGVEGDEVELAPHLARDVDELPGMLVSVVDAVEHDVFESNEITWRMLEIAIARIEQLTQGMFSVQWNQTVAQCVIWRVERNRQRDRTIAGKTIHDGNDARSRYGDPPARQAIGVIVQHQPQRC